MDKKEIYQYLNEQGVWFEVTEHKAVYNMTELAGIDCPYPDADAKNLFLRDDKKRNYYLVTVKGDKHVDLKAFREENKTRPLSFASESELMSIMGLLPGAVTPFGVLNDAARKVNVFIDEALLQSGMIGVHPNDNTATVWLKTQDLISILKAHGNAVHTTHL